MLNFSKRKETKSAAFAQLCNINVCRSHMIMRSAIEIDFYNEFVCFPTPTGLDFLHQVDVLLCEKPSFAQGSSVYEKKNLFLYETLE